MTTNDEPHPPTGNASSGNMVVHELEEETARKVRGDTIGDTTYSEAFVLKTLQYYSELKWNSEVENDLRRLWDMTREKAVCEFLLEASYPKLATSAIRLHNESRFIEIVVGIYANLVCPECEETITKEEVKTVLNLLNCDNPNILIQVMRFLQALSSIFSTLGFVEEVHLNRFDFILSNSVNKKLLSCTLKTLVSITADTKVQEDLLHGELLKSVLIGYGVLKGNFYHEVNCFRSHEQRRHVKYLINFVYNLCTYVDYTLSDQIMNGLIENLNKFINEVKSLLKFYRNAGNLLPMTDDVRFYMEAFTYICRVLNVVYVFPIARALYQIFCTLYKRDLSNLDAVAELFCYFISVGRFKDLKKDFRIFCPLEMREIFSYIIKQNFQFEFDYESNLIRFLKGREC